MGRSRHIYLIQGTFDRKTQLSLSPATERRVYDRTETMPEDIWQLKC